MQAKYKELISILREKFLKNKDFIPLHEPAFNGNEKKYLNNAIDSGFVSSVGEYVNLFEEKLADYTGSKYAVATVNGTSALHISLLICGVLPEDEVITQAITFIATANAISYTGAKPVFIDIASTGFGMSPVALEKFLKENTIIQNDGYCYNKESGKRIKACIPVHVFGLMADMDNIIAICNQYNIEVIEDAAESIGTTINKISSGRFGKVGAFSFNGNKIITSGGGGAIITDDDEKAKLAKHLTTTAKKNHIWFYEHDMIGYNYRMPNINAALLCAQLEQLNDFLLKKRELANFYHGEFDKLEIEYIKEGVNELNNNWLIHMIVDNKVERDEFLEYSNSQGLMSRPLWTLMTDLKMYQDCQHDGLENSRYFSERVVNLPSSSSLI